MAGRNLLLKQRLLNPLPVLVVAALSGACDRSSPPVPTAAPPPLEVSFETLNRGARLYQEHCAQCHGPEAQGHPDWQTPGVVAAPPLNGTGTDTKRSRAALIAVIKNGAKRDGAPIMPGWAGRLSEEEIADVIVWFQALWPAEVLAGWHKQNAAASGPRG